MEDTGVTFDIRKACRIRDRAALEAIRHDGFVVELAGAQDRAHLIGADHCTDPTRMSQGPDAGACDQQAENS
jgi:hypothetical protein